MAVPTTNVTFTSIQTEFGGSTPISLSEYQGALTGTGQATTALPSGQISVSDIRGQISRFTFNISGNVNNINLRTSAVSAGWNQQAHVVAYIVTGAIVSATSTLAAALSITGTFPQGVTLIIQSGAYVVGKGGNGGNGSSWLSNNTGTPSTSGGGGGGGIAVSTNVTIYNYGTIAGGGGGGGGGDHAKFYDGYGTLYQSYGGGGGGGGMSNLNNSSGGNAGVGWTANGTAGAAGTSSGGGAGGTVSVAGKGGNGGYWGAAGTAGEGKATGYNTASYVAAGPAGACTVSIGGTITWGSTGTRYGLVA